MVIKARSDESDKEKNPKIIYFGAPDENQAAYKNFVAPEQEEHKFAEMSQKDISDFAANLELKDSRDLQKFMITLLCSHSKTLSRIEQLEKLLVDKLINTQIYLLTHKSKMLVKIGYSDNIENRLRTHRRNDWLVLATGPGTKEREKAMLQILKENGIRPEPSSDEIFAISSKLVELLCANNWVGANEYKMDILDRFPQKKIFSV